MRRVLLLSALAALPHLASGQTTTATFLDYKTTVPAGWTSRAPSSNMRLAEYVIPGPESAEVVVYFFGQGQGGNVAANLTRWKSQFSMPDGSPVPEAVTHDSTGKFPITFAEYRGTYARGVGAGDASQAKPGQMLIAGIAETPRGTIFVQLFGAAASVAAQREAFTKFVSSLAH